METSEVKIVETEGKKQLVRETIKRIDGHGCNGCYNCKSEHLGIYYCKAKIVKIKLLHEIINIGHPIVDNKSEIRPEWCPLERADGTKKVHESG